MGDSDIHSHCFASLPSNAFTISCSANKAGFVDRQAFLSRVDERKFELEREQRAKERSRAEMVAMQAQRR